MKQGWEIKKLKEVADYFIGLTYSPKDVNDTGTIVLRSSNVQNGILDFADIIRVNKTIKEGLKVKEGDILMCSRNGSKRLVGKTATIEGLSEVMTFGTFMTVIRSPYNSYLAWFFKSDEFRDQLGIGEYTMINQVTKYMLDEISLPFPPIPEQKRIVAILDEAFAAIAKAKANAEQNLKNAKELFESYLQGVFENKGKGWEESRLGDVCSIGDGNYSSKYPKASEFVSEGVPFLTATNLKNGTVIPHGIRFISKEQHASLTKGHINKGDLVIVVRGSSTGNNSIVPAEYTDSNLNSQLAFLRVIENKISSEYLFAVFNSPPVMKTVKAAISGAAQPQLPNNKLLDIKISYPTISEQKIIVNKLEALSDETKKLEAIYQQKINDLDELKKSVLQKAFSGELKTRKAELA